MDSLSPEVMRILEGRAADAGLTPEELITMMLRRPSPQAMLDALPVCGLLLSATPPYPILAANTAFEAYTGLRTEDIRGEPWYVLLDDGEPPPLEEGSYRGRHLFTLPGGGSQLHEVIVTPLGNGTDAPAHLLAQLADLPYSEQLAHFMDETNEGIWAVDLDGHTLYINQPMAAMLGYTIEELSALSLWDVTHEDVRQQARHNLEERRNGKSQQHEFRFVHKQGHDVWVVINTTPLKDDSGHVYGALGFITDITTRVEVQQQLATSEARYKLLTELMSDYAFAVDVDESGTMTLNWLTGAYEEITGEPTPEPGTTFTFEQTHPEDLYGLMAAYDRLLNNEPVITQTRAFRPDGSMFWLEVKRIPIWDEEAGRVVGFYGAASDITARKHAEEQLKHSEARYKLLTELITDYVFRVDVAEDGTMRLGWLTGAFTSILGLEVPPPGSPIEADQARIHPDDLAAHDADIQHLLANNRVTSTYRAQHADGGYIWLEVTRTPIWDEEAGRVVGFYGAASDITARKHAEDELKRSEARFRTISDMTSDYAFAFSVKEDGTLEREWVTAASVERITGFMPEEITERGGWQGLTHPGDIPMLKRQLAQLLSEGGQVQSLYRIVTKSGETRHIEGLSRAIRDEGGRVVRILGSAKDVTAQHTARQELAESEARFRTMANHAPVLIWMTDTKAACTYLNEQWLAFTGRTLEQELGHGWVAGIHPEDIERCMHIYNTAFEARQPFSIEYRLRRHDGVYRWMLDDGVPRFYPDGGFAGYIGSCVDVTEQRDAKRALESLVAEKTQNLKAANDELRRLTRLKDEWVSNVSHELRSPLTSLRVRIHLLETDPTMLADHLPALARETRRLSDTIEDLLKLSRWDQDGVEIKRQLVDIDGLLRDFVADRQMAADEHDLHLRYIPCPDPQETLCDPGLISQVIDILISNALKYVPAGGEIVARSLSEAGRVGFAIEDDGPGIPPHERPHLFERFYRGETGRSSGRKGTGLGLSIAKTIVDHHGGSISMSSEPGSGTTFTVWLPLTKKGRPPEG